MFLKINLILLFLLMFIKINDGQNLETIINEKVHLTEEDMDQSNLSNDEESERIKQHSTYSYQQQTEQQQQQSSDINDMQSPSSEIQTKKIHHPNFLIRNPIFNNQNSISKTNTQHNQHILSKTRPIITHNSHNSFTELDNQQVIQQQQQFDNEMDYQQSTSTQTPFNNLDTQMRDNNWPFSGSSTNNLVLASKPNSGIAGEFTINSNTLNFTSNQGLDNLKVFNITATNHILPPVTFSNIIPATTNYNQQDPLSSHQIIANPIQNLVLRSFEYYRHLIKNCEPIENFLITKMNLPKNKMILHSLDPLELNEPLYWTSRDNKTPMLGKLKFTLDFVQVNGLSTFKTENLSNQGRTLYFK